MRELVVIRGGGDIATGVIQKFKRVGKRILVLETEKPLAIRRTVSLSQCVYENYTKVEDIEAKLVTNESEINDCFETGHVPVIVDPDGHYINKLKPICVIDAIIAKKNYGTNKNMAPITIGLGPGFCAGVDVDLVIETMRGHDLGRLIFDGTAQKNTGIPGEILNKSYERVIHANNSGLLKNKKNIGDIVKEGDIILTIDKKVHTSPFTGILRGIIMDEINVSKGLKIADIDPRLDIDCYTISDKARAIGGACLEGFFIFMNKYSKI